MLVGPGVIHTPAAGVATPFGCVEFQPADRVLGHHLAKRIETCRFVARIEGAAKQETVGKLGLEGIVLDMRVEAVLVKLIEIGRVENGHVDVTAAEQIVDHHLLAVATELVERPYRLRRAEAAVIGVETLGPALSVFVAPVLWIGVPQMGVAIDDEDVLSIMIVHKGPLRLADWIGREYRRGAWPG